jgi:uncharacterized protein
MVNRLAQCQSLYLQKHAENPIDWWFWSPEALEQAKTDNKPIFLSIGYSSCHWCTVMEGEAFSDPAIAAYLNQYFLPIKVDREERPDLDSIYMQALQMMIGQGGWPLNIFLTPDDLVPFYGGTYFPVEPRYGRPGFLQVLQSIRRFYDVETEKLNNFKQEILNLLQSSTILTVSPENILNQELLNQGFEVSTGIIQPNYPGSPSFPMIPYSQLALQGTLFELKSRYDGKNLTLQRGKDLALGGIYDHVGGGFHRYTVDATWTVPHFEKMLYDNGQIVEYLANLWSLGHHEPAFKRAIKWTIQWLKREMTSPEGYFYGSQDADSFVNAEDQEPEEGAFYVWRYRELEEILSPEGFRELELEFTVTGNGNFEGNNVLQREGTETLSPTLEQALEELFKVRYGDFPEKITIFKPVINNQEARNFPNYNSGRIPPVTDPKMIVAWNSLMISGLARTYAVFQDQIALELATQAANFILTNQWQNGRFYRLNYQGKPSIFGQSEDYALFIKALLDLQACCPQEDHWIEKAIKIQDEFDEYFWSVEMGGYYNNSSDASQDLLIRERSYQDNATPSANGIAVSNLVRLFLLTENLDYLQKAEQILQAFSNVLSKTPQACPSLFNGLNWYLHGTIVKTNQETLTNLVSRYLPTTVYRLETNLPPDTVGLVCKGLSCLDPAKSLEELLNQI